MDDDYTVINSMVAGGPAAKSKAISVVPELALIFPLISALRAVSLPSGVREMNAFAMANGCIRVYSGLMDMMTDNEVEAVIVPLARAL